jgi:hypothetical protein
MSDKPEDNSTYDTKGHKAAFLNNSNSSSFAKHLSDETHSFSPINDIMKMVHCHKKGAHLNTTEKFHIHTEFAAGNHLNDPNTIAPNAIFDALLKPIWP